MEHSPKFNTVKAYYDSRRWSRQMVLNAAKNPAGNPWITEAEAAEILGETAQANDAQGEAAQEGAGNE